MIKLLFYPAFCAGFVWNILVEGFKYGRKACDQHIERETFKVHPDLSDEVFQKGVQAGRIQRQAEIKHVFDSANDHDELVVKMMHTLEEAQ